jgi:hypothetical protein
MHITWETNQSFSIDSTQINLVAQEFEGHEIRHNNGEFVWQPIKFGGH